MDKTQNKFIRVSYKLYTIQDGKKTLEEMTHEDHPFEFISGFGIALDGFEKHVADLEKGSTFDFVLAKEEAFGDYNPEGSHKLNREIFTIDGKFDSEHIYEGAIITMQDAEGHHFPARVVSIEEDGVTIDTNPPLAGKDLNFTGEVMENREATDEEIQKLIQKLTGGGCCGDGCGCGCGDDCDCDCEKDGCDCKNKADKDHKHHNHHDHKGGGCHHCHHHE